MIYKTAMATRLAWLSGKIVKSRLAYCKITCSSSVYVIILLKLHLNWGGNSLLVLVDNFTMFSKPIHTVVFDVRITLLLECLLTFSGAAHDIRKPYKSTVKRIIRSFTVRLY